MGGRRDGGKVGEEVREGRGEGGMRGGWDEGKVRDEEKVRDEGKVRDGGR